MAKCPGDYIFLSFQNAAVFLICPKDAGKSLATDGFSAITSDFIFLTPKSNSIRENLKSFIRKS